MEAETIIYELKEVVFFHVDAWKVMNTVQRIALESKAHAAPQKCHFLKKYYHYLKNSCIYKMNEICLMTLKLIFKICLV